MRILYVIDSMTKDGAESQLLKTLDRLPPEQYEVYVVLSRAEGERCSGTHRDVLRPRRCHAWA